MARITYDDQTAAAYKASARSRETGSGRGARRSGGISGHADTNMRGLTEEEFLRGKEQLRRAVKTARTETRTNWLDLLVLR